MQVTIADTLLNGSITDEFDIELETDTLSIADLIAKRVTAEVEKRNSKLHADCPGLVKPTETERLLNGSRAMSLELVDVEQQVYVALDAFQKNGFFVLIDDVQALDLDQVVTLKDTSQVSFVRLTPLVGG